MEFPILEPKIELAHFEVGNCIPGSSCEKCCFSMGKLSVAIGGDFPKTVFGWITNPEDAAIDWEWYGDGKCDPAVGNRLATCLASSV